MKTNKLILIILSIAVLEVMISQEVFALRPAATKVVKSIIPNFFLTKIQYGDTEREWPMPPILMRDGKATVSNIGYLHINNSGEAPAEQSHELLIQLKSLGFNIKEDSVPYYDFSFKSQEGMERIYSFFDSISSEQGLVLFVPDIFSDRSAMVIFTAASYYALFRRDIPLYIIMMDESAAESPKESFHKSQYCDFVETLNRTVPVSLFIDGEIYYASLSEEIPFVLSYYSSVEKCLEDIKLQNKIDEDLSVPLGGKASVRINSTLDKSKIPTEELAKVTGFVLHYIRERIDEYGLIETPYAIPALLQYYMYYVEASSKAYSSLEDVAACMDRADGALNDLLALAGCAPNEKLTWLKSMEFKGLVDVMQEIAHTSGCDNFEQISSAMNAILSIIHNAGVHKKGRIADLIHRFRAGDMPWIIDSYDKFMEELTMFGRYLKEEQEETGITPADKEREFYEKRKEREKNIGPRPGRRWEPGDLLPYNFVSINSKYEKVEDSAWNLREVIQRDNHIRRLINAAA